MVNKWITIDTVLADLAMSIPTTYWSEANAREWAFQAMRKLGVLDQFDRDIDLLPVEDYRAVLPDDYYLLELMAYKLDTTTLTADDLIKIRADLGLSNDLYYTGFLNNSAFLSEYRPLRLSRSPFALSVHCDECINLYSVSEHTYTIHPNNTLTVSFQTGSICCAYRKYAKDCDSYLIPDDQDYIDAVRAYILMRVWEFRMNTKEEGSEKLFTYYAGKWAVMRKSVPGKLRLPNIDTLENLRQMTNRLVRKDRDYYRGFSHRPEENTDF